MKITEEIHGAHIFNIIRAHSPNIIKHKPQGKNGKKQYLKR